MNYKQKYLKYKLKYLTAKKMYGGSENESKTGSWTSQDLMMPPEEVGQRFVDLEERVKKLEKDSEGDLYDDEEVEGEIRSWGSGQLGMDAVRVAERFGALEKRVEELEKLNNLERVRNSGWGPGPLGMSPSLVAQRFVFLKERVERLEKPEKRVEEEESGSEDIAELGPWGSGLGLWGRDESLERSPFASTQRVDELEKDVTTLKGDVERNQKDHADRIRALEKTVDDLIITVGILKEYHDSATGEHYRELGFPPLDDIGAL